jgi:hypothetical protein
MALLFDGSMAPYRHRTECTWVYGKGTGTIGSTSYGSCVGLVLFRPLGNAGAVAHFAGSMGAPDEKHRVESDVDEIVGRCRDGTHGEEEWQAWVFGGTSLAQGGHDSSTKMLERSRSLLDTVRAALPSVARWRALKIELKNQGYPGYLGVKLNLGTGKIAWETSGTSNTGDSGKKKTSPYL